MELADFKNVNYPAFQKAINAALIDSGISDVKLADSVNVKALNSVRNVFNPVKQVSSDELVTKVCNVLRIKAIIVWINGKRNYYISTNKK